MILIKCFTDPICTWCWGSEPILRKLETHFAHQIQFEHIMGGLVDDIKGFMDEGNGIGGSSAAEFNRQVAEHWLEASAKHKMPVNSSDFDLFSDEYPSTFPQNIAYKAAQLSDESKACFYTTFAWHQQQRQEKAIVRKYCLKSPPNPNSMSRNLQLI